MKFPLDRFKSVETPFYYYDQNLLQATLDTITCEAGKYEGFKVHYAVKACVDQTVLGVINASGIGCDCVSGGEVERCLMSGFAPSKIVFAGVGKADWEINLALDANIACFNVESVPELEVIDELARAKVRSLTSLCVLTRMSMHILTSISQQVFRKTNSVSLWRCSKKLLQRQRL